MLKRYIPFAHAKSIYEIEPDFYIRNGFKFILVDLDNTLDSYKQETPTEKAFELVEKLQAKGLKLIITSNNTGKRVKKYAEILGIDYLNSVGKPFSKKLLKKLKEANIPVEESVMIGDQTFTDISAANGAKIKSVLTDKIVKEDQPTTRFNRLFDRPIRKSLSKKNLLIDWRER